MTTSVLRFRRWSGIRPTWCRSPRTTRPGRLEDPCPNEIESTPVSDIGRPDQRTVRSGRAVHTHEHSLHAGSSLQGGHNERRSIIDAHAWSWVLEATVPDVVRLNCAEYA
jgi:hypothetical protein